MKFRFLALGLMAMLAVVAVAQVLRPHPEKALAMARSTEGSRRPATAVVSPLPAPTARNEVAMDAGRAPVPVLVSHHRAFAAVVEPASADTPAHADAAISANMTETTAKAAIEADGYKGVHALALGSDGTWKAIALRGQTEVSLRVDPTGSVSAN